MLSRCPLIVAMLLFVSLAGCAKKPPELTVVTGTVTMNGSPVPSVYVQFIPQLDEFGAEYNSTAVTDAQGKFSLICSMNAQSGAAVCEHRVLITEAPASEEFRGMDGQSQANYAAYLRGLKNRPIPPKYGTVLHTPLKVEVVKDKQQYDLLIDPS